jgi:uncharacterized protein YbbK (DUF523 family)
MEKLLVSSCLMGCKVRYNGSDLPMSRADFGWLAEHFELVSFCPEVAGGLPTPRPPAEIDVGAGLNVLSGGSRVIGNDGVDVSEAFINGAYLALQVCQTNNIRFAMLTESSPSCGSATIYDGSFGGIKKQGQGVAAALLVQHGIHVFSQETFNDFKVLMENNDPKLSGVECV